VARSTKAKAGKMSKLLAQLKAYRTFGSPDVSLLDVFLCEGGALETWPGSAQEAIIAKAEACKDGGFGYDMTAFEGGELASPPAYFRARPWSANPLHTTATLVRPVTSPVGEPFMTLVARIDDFCQAHASARKMGQQVYFCRGCQQLQLVHARTQGTCPSCQSELALQT
jgi:hypothetical protein